MFTRIISALTGLFLLATPALAEPAAHRITFSPGGVIMDFYKKYAEWRVNGDRVVIDGMCISACTLVVGLIPSDRLCVTPFARMAFHSAWQQGPFGPQFSREGTRLMWFTYPQNVREYLVRRQWQEGMEHPELIYVEGSELHNIIRPCTSEEQEGTAVTSIVKNDQ